MMLQESCCGAALSRVGTAAQGAWMIPCTWGSGSVPAKGPWSDMVKAGPHTQYCQGMDCHLLCPAGDTPQMSPHTGCCCACSEHPVSCSSVFGLGQPCWLCL